MCIIQKEILKNKSKFIYKVVYRTDGKYRSTYANTYYPKVRKRVTSKREQISSVPNHSFIIEKYNLFIGYINKKDAIDDCNKRPNMFKTHVLKVSIHKDSIVFSAKFGRKPCLGINRWIKSELIYKT